MRAKLDGVLQRLPLSLGQSVNTGDELALVGSLTSLVAEIKVPQLQADMVLVGSEAEIDTRHGLVQGKVLRIDPVVEEGLSTSISVCQPTYPLVFDQCRWWMP